VRQTRVGLRVCMYKKEERCLVGGSCAMRSLLGWVCHVNVKKKVNEWIKQVIILQILLFSFFLCTHTLKNYQSAR